MRLELDKADRDFLLADLEEGLETIGEAFSNANRGREWDAYGAYNSEGIMQLVAARDDLLDGPPWALEAPKRDLEDMLGRFRASSTYVLGLGTDTIGGRVEQFNVSRPEDTDRRLDMIALVDRLLPRLLEADGE